MLDMLETRCSVWCAISYIAHICMADMTSVISFLLILFHYWAAFVVYRQNWVNNTTLNSLTNNFFVNLIQVGSFPFPKTCHTYTAMMRLSMIIPYLMKIQNIYKSRDTAIKFCWHQYIFTKNQQLYLYQEIQIKIAL